MSLDSIFEELEDSKNTKKEEKNPVKKPISIFDAQVKRKDVKGEAEAAVLKAQANLAKMTAEQILDLAVGFQSFKPSMDDKTFETKLAKYSAIPNANIRSARVARDKATRKALTLAFKGVEHKFKNWGTLAKTPIMISNAKELWSRILKAKDSTELGSLTFSKLQFITCDFNEGLAHIEKHAKLLVSTIAMAIKEKHFKMENNGSVTWFSAIDGATKAQQEKMKVIFLKCKVLDPRWMAINKAYRLAKSDQEEDMKAAIFKACEIYMFKRVDKIMQDMSGNSDYSDNLITGMSIVRRFQRSAIKLLSPNAVGRRAKVNFMGKEVDIEGVDWSDEIITAPAASVIRRLEKLKDTDKEEEEAETKETDE